MGIPETNVYARDLAWRLFRDAADEDYLNARWAMRANITYQFAWSAQQCIEKLLKCALILNDYDVKGYGHDLTEMWEIASNEADDLLATILCPPRYFPNELRARHGRFEPVSSFVERVEQAGDANQRYRYYSLSTEGYDIHKLDELVFLLRRITYPLKMEYGEANVSYREYLRLNRSIQPHNEFSFERRNWKRGHEERMRAFRWRNFAFSEQRALKAKKLHTGTSSINSPIYMNTRRGDDGREALEWILSKAYFSKSDRAAIISAVMQKD